jgi:hypothetical protein
VACPITNLGEAEAEVLHLREALLRSEAELEMERELRRNVEADNMIERQLRYEVEGELQECMAREVESERRANNLTDIWLEERLANLKREVDEVRSSKYKWQIMINCLTNGAAQIAFELCACDEIAKRIPARRRGRIRRWLVEGHREMMLDRQRSRESTPPL